MKEQFTLQISTRIYKTDLYVGESLSVAQEVQVLGKDFLDICRILGEFKELADRIKLERAI